MRGRAAWVLLEVIRGQPVVARTDELVEEEPGPTGDAPDADPFRGREHGAARATGADEQRAPPRAPRARGGASAAHRGGPPGRSTASEAPQQQGHERRQDVARPRPAGPEAEAVVLFDGRRHPLEEPVVRTRIRQTDRAGSRRARATPRKEGRRAAPGRARCPAGTRPPPPDRPDARRGLAGLVRNGVRPARRAGRTATANASRVHDQAGTGASSHPAASSRTSVGACRLRRRLSRIFQRSRSPSGFGPRAPPASGTRRRTQAAICQSPRTQRCSRTYQVFGVPGYSS